MFVFLCLRTDLDFDRVATLQVEVTKRYTVTLEFKMQGGFEDWRVPSKFDKGVIGFRAVH